MRDDPSSYTRDPKDIVTETAFRVDSELLGTALGSPWRRLGAMLLDLVAVGALVLFKEISAGLFAIAVAWIMWRVARPDVDVHLRRAWMRWVLRVAAGVVFIAGLGMFVSQFLPGEEGDEYDSTEATEEALDSATTRADSLQAVLRAREAQLMDRLIAAARAGDTARAAELREDVMEASARRRVEPLLERLDRLEDRVDEARSPPGIVDFVRQILNDLGLGFSWLALYFTAFVKLWQGRTPGKRLLGLRVVKVRGGAIGWWDAFGRFGGYAASVITGLVGFAQVFWDPNRQGLHDRIAGTVVVRE